MSQIKAFQILSKLTGDEFSDFSQFIASPFFNRSKDLNKFFSAIKKYYPLFDSPNLEYEKLYKKLYPGRKFNEGTISNLLSDLGSLAERYLGYVHYEEGFFYKYNVLMELNDRAFDKLFVKSHKKFTEENDNDMDTTDQKSLYSYLLDNEMTIHKIRTNIDLDVSTRDLGAESLLVYFLVSFFDKDYDWHSKYYNANLLQDYNIVKDFFDKTDFAGIISGMRKNNVAESDKVEIHFVLHLALNSGGDDCYNNAVHALSLIRSLPEGTNVEQICNFYVAVLNVINYHMKSDDRDLKQLSFEIKKEMVDKGMTSERLGKLKEIEFITILDAAINVQELEWAKNFLENKIKAVEKSLQFDLYNFYKARILFDEKNYIECNEFLSKVNNEGFILKMDVKTLKMRNFYELDFIEAGFSAADALKQFILRTDILSPNRKEGFTNFVKFYKILLKKKTDMDKDVSIL